MKKFTVRFSDKLHKTVKHHLVDLDMPMQDYVIGLIKRDLKFDDSMDDLSDYSETKSAEKRRKYK